MALVGPYDFGLYFCVVIYDGLCGVVVSWSDSFIVK